MNVPTKSFFTKVVGVSFDNGDGISRQQILEEVADDIVHRGPMKLHVLRDNENPHDSNAIAIVDQDYRQIGFLSRDVSAQIAPLIDEQLIDTIDCEVSNSRGVVINDGDRFVLAG